MEAQEKIGVKTRLCKNCYWQFEGDFCNKCGQRNADRISYRHIATDISEEIVGVESGLLYTAKSLWLAPGKMVARYLSGVRKRYYSPLKYLFLWTAIYFILSKANAKEGELKSLDDLIFNSNIAFSKESLSDFGSLYLVMISRHIDIFYLFMAPFLAVISYFLFQKSNYYYTELMVAYLYLCGQLVFLAIIVFIVNFIFGAVVLIPGMVISLLLLFYLLFKMHKQMFRQNWPVTVGKSFIIMYGGQILYGFTTYFLLNVFKLIS